MATQTILTRGERQAELQAKSVELDARIAALRRKHLIDILEEDHLQRGKSNPRVKFPEKYVEIDNLTNELEPIKKELSVLSFQENLESELPGIEASIAEGRKEIQQRNDLENSFHSRLRDLRAIAERLPWPAAKNAADALEHEWVLRRPDPE